MSWHNGEEILALWKKISSKMQDPALFDEDYKRVILKASDAISARADPDCLLTACRIIESIAMWCVKFASVDNAIEVGLVLVDERVLGPINNYLRAGESTTRWPVVALCSALENIVDLPWRDAKQKLNFLRVFFSPNLLLHEALLACCCRHSDSLVVATTKVLESLMLQAHTTVMGEVAAGIMHDGTGADPSAGAVSGEGLSAAECLRMEDCFSSVLPGLLDLLLSFKDNADVQEQVLRGIGSVVECTELQWMMEPRIEARRLELVRGLTGICAEYCANCEKQLGLAASGITLVKYLSRLDRSTRATVASNARLVVSCMAVLRRDVAFAGEARDMDVARPANVLRRGACAVIHNVCLDPEVAERLCYLETVDKTAPFGQHSLSEDAILTIKSTDAFKNVYTIRTLLGALLVEDDPRIFRDVWLTLSLLARYPQNIHALLDGLVQEMCLECICVHLTEASGYAMSSNVIIKSWTRQGAEVCALLTLARICGACCNPRLVASSEADTAQINKIYKQLRSSTMLRVLRYLASLNPLLDLNGHSREDVEAIRSLGMLCLCALYGRRGTEVMQQVADMVKVHRGSASSYRYDATLVTALQRAVRCAHNAGATSNPDPFFSCQVNWLLYAMSSLCVNWAYSRALATCGDLISTLSLMLGRFAGELAASESGSLELRPAAADGADEYWRDSSVLECLLQCLLHLYLSLPAPRAPAAATSTAATETSFVSYDVDVEKGGAGVALGMMVVQEADGVIRLKSIQRNAPVRSIGPEADGCLCTGDVLVGVNGQDITGWDLATVVVELNDKNLPPGKTVRLTYRRPLSRVSMLWLQGVRGGLEALLLSFFRCRRAAPCVVTDTAARHGMLLLGLMGQAHHPSTELCRNPVYDLTPTAAKEKGTLPAPASPTAVNDKSCSVWNMPEPEPKPAAAAGRTILVCHAPDRLPDGAGSSLFTKFIDALRDQATYLGGSVVTSTELLETHHALFSRLAAASDTTAATLRADAGAMLRGLVVTVRGCDAVGQCITETFKYSPLCRLIGNVVHHCRAVTANQTQAAAAAAAQSQLVCNILLSKSFSPRSVCKESLRHFQEDSFTQRVLLGNADMVSLPSERVRELPYQWLPLWRRDSALSWEVDCVKVTDTLLRVDGPMSALKDTVDTPLRSNYPILTYMMSNPAAAAAKRQAEEEAVVQNHKSRVDAARFIWEEKAAREKEMAAQAARVRAQEEAAEALRHKEEEEEQARAQRANEEADAAALAEQVKEAQRARVSEAEAVHKKAAATNANAFTLTSIFNWWEARDA